jgi:hypothetical protein
MDANERGVGPENPPAFPSVCMNDPGNPASVSGMSLRDWFAGQAPVTLFDAAMACGWSSLDAADMAQDSHRVVLWAVMTLMRYEYADAMLATRGERA